MSSCRIWGGIEATRLVLSRHPGLLIVMFTMYRAPDVVQRALEAGARGYVYKSQGIEDVISATAWSDFRFLQLHEFPVMLCQSNWRILYPEDPESELRRLFGANDLGSRALPGKSANRSGR